MMAKKKTNEAWVSRSISGDGYFFSQCKPKWCPYFEGPGGKGYWRARGEECCYRCIAVTLFRLRRLKHNHAYRVDLRKALDGKPFILETLKPPKGK